MPILKRHLLCINNCNRSHIDNLVDIKRPMQNMNRLRQSGQNRTDRDQTTVSNVHTDRNPHIAQHASTNSDTDPNLDWRPHSNEDANADRSG